LVPSSWYHAAVLRHTGAPPCTAFKSQLTTVKSPSTATARPHGSSHKSPPAAATHQQQDGNNQPRSRSSGCILWGQVNFGGRRNKEKTKRAIKGKPQSTSADYWFPVSLVGSPSSLYFRFVTIKTSLLLPHQCFFNSLK
jgi:hypothetical protein